MNKLAGTMMKPDFAKHMERVTPSAIMELLKTAGTGEYISFASGLPDPALFPGDLLRETADRALTSDAAGALQYGPAEGDPPLRAWVAERLQARGFAALPEQILLTSGSQQALDLVARAFLNDGDRVAIESPAYLAALQVCDSYGAAYRSIPQDEEAWTWRRRRPRSPPAVSCCLRCPIFRTRPGARSPANAGSGWRRGWIAREQR
jgi:2-aminoadipate transaminase